MIEDLSWGGVIFAVSVFVATLMGSLLIVVGIILALPGVPGQGLLTVLIGLVLVDLPGKRRRERRIVGRPRVLRAINRLRRRFHRAPLVLDSQRAKALTKATSAPVGRAGNAGGRNLPSRAPGAPGRLDRVMR